ncbi:dTDP-4-dehydrorhamnose 3,5-epimerase [Thioalkalivibrio sp. ALE11]|uniref:dTDP-4-dehydrorhamnose 3,5-epimerase n=1 Tax=Thioalkalivibrio sp. ALE11 TaxID=1265494 RepID=UPI000377CB25|nr:dTDP-4-dehydrorhamnose 3,5-epimerase [Thioalkalivibrio sp. ALE11]
MKAYALSIPAVLLLEPRVFEDERGFFYESYNQQVFDEAVGEPVTFVQDNHSRSVKGTLRGLHYQLPPHPQGKLVRVTLGEVFDVAVDIRRGSPTFGQWVGETLSAGNRRQLWIPSGFAHGFVVTTDVAELQYKCTDFYAPDYERSIRWDDADLDIDWPLDGDPLISAKDAQAEIFRNAKVFNS